MRKIHLSKDTYQASPGDLRGKYQTSWDMDERPEAACGAEGYAARRGTGAGLIPPLAVSVEAHCPVCVAIVRSGKAS